MKISYNWLADYLDLNMQPDKISNLLTDIGLEVESVKTVESVKGNLKGVVIGKVLTKTQHLNADRLAVTTVDVGCDEPLQIVCGAPNVASGQKVPVATVGTILYDGDTSFKIKKSKIRGEVSEGMICGADEIGLGEETDGIMVLDSNAKIGIPASEYFQLDSDTIFDIGLTPNRSDAMGHIGVARDLMAVLNHQGGKFQMCKPSVAAFKVANNKRPILVDVKDTDLCPRYSGVSISGVSVDVSPDWLRNRLKAIGIAPINNVVDITNYVLHEIGQPLHAFDIAKISGEKIIVSTLKDKTKFTTLDHVNRELSSSDLMINNADQPMCIAGIYGGKDSGVCMSTTDVFIESAYFNPVSIRKTAKRHLLSTDASFRYERGCDPDITVYALKRAALLINEICGGVISSEIIDIYPKKIAHSEVTLYYSNIDKLIGQVIERSVIKSILHDLDIKIVDSHDKGLNLLVPLFRADVYREVDVIEEVLRIYGFNTVEIPTRLNIPITSPKLVNVGLIRNIISELLSYSGFDEAINNSLTKGEYSALIPEINSNQDVVLMNPLSKELNVMRQSLIFSGLENIAYNQNRKITDVKLYEFGKTYHKSKLDYLEKQHLQLLVSGRVQSENWNSNNGDVDFFFIKEKVESIIHRLAIKKVKKAEDNSFGFDYSLTYSVNSRRLVTFGRINRSLLEAFDIRSEVYVADFNLDLLLELVGGDTTHYKEISVFPEVRRDLSLLLDKSVSFAELQKIARQVDDKILRKVSLFDIYEGDKLPKGKKSYALSFIMSDNTMTLTDDRVDKVMVGLIQSFKDKVGADLR
tara:strand:- start:18665 stop:21088 length:2424 start_codon:yes stop_codon:yes gene_type:complete